MNTSIFFDARLSDDQRRVRFYSGDIFVLSETRNNGALVALARCGLPHPERKANRAVADARPFESVDKWTDFAQLVSFMLDFLKLYTLFT
jgi:hypothetical protein